MYLKRKVHKKHEFACKVSVVNTTRDNCVLRVQVLHDNPYDSHTLASANTREEILSDGVIDTVEVDHGYRGQDYEGTAEVHFVGEKRISRSLKKWFNRRNAIEPVIGYLSACRSFNVDRKIDNGLGWNYLKGVERDRINAILAGCGFNFRKAYTPDAGGNLGALLFVPDFIQTKFDQILQIIRNIDHG